MSLFFAYNSDEIIKDKDRKPIWELAGLDSFQFSKLPQRERRRLIKLHRPNWVIPMWKTPFLVLRQKFLLWWNEPRGGYLFDRWTKDNAEQETIFYNFPRLRREVRYRTSSCKINMGR